MKLDWRKITRNLLLTETVTKDPVNKLFNNTLEHLNEFKSLNRNQEFQINEIIENVIQLNNMTNSLLTENKSLKERINILEENKINEFLD